MRGRKCTREITPFGKFVLKLAEERGWSEAELSNQLGISGVYLRQVLRGQCPIFDGFIDRIVETFEQLSVDTYNEMMKTVN